MLRITPSACAILFFMLGDARQELREGRPVNRTIGKTRVLVFLVVAICVVVLILIGVLTWEDIVATVTR